MGLEMLQICAMQVGTCKAVLLLKGACLGRREIGGVTGLILNCDLASGEPEITSALTL